MESKSPLSDRLLRLAHDLQNVGGAGWHFDPASLVNLGAFMERHLLELRRQERTLYEIVAEASEDEQQKAARERRAREIAAIVAGVPGFQEPTHISKEGWNND